MRWIRTLVGEAYGLLVDDGWLAAATLAWLLLAWLVLPRLGVDGGWAGLILFAGLAAILLGSVLRGGAR